MSGLGLLSDYNNDSELSDTDDRAEGTKEPPSKPVGGPKLATSNDSGRSDKLDNKEKEGDGNSKHSGGRLSYDDKRSDKHRDYKRDDRSRDERPRDDRSRDERSRDERSRDDRSRDDRSRDDRSRDDRSRDDRSRDDRRYDHKTDDRRYRSRDYKRRDYRGRDHRDLDRQRSKQEEKLREYDEYRRRKYGDSRDWGKVSADSLKDVKTDSTLPSTFDSTIAKQLAAQREKRKLLWGKKEGEGSSSQKSVWGSDSIRNDETGEQTAKFLKLMGVKDVTAQNVKDYKRTDDSVLRSSQAVDSMETEYEKSRYLQHINKGVGLGLVQFNKPPP